MPILSIIILTYNSERFIDDLFSSILEKIGGKIASGEYELLIADNDSKDGTYQKVKKYLSHNIHFIQNNENAGYGKGINMASKSAKGTYILVINPDAILTNQDFDKVIEYLDSHPPVAIAGCRIVDIKGKEENNAGTFFNPFTFLLYALGLEHLFHLRFSPNQVQKVDFVSGGFVFFRRDHFKQLKGYDEDYFMYVEDMDICYRAWKNGFEVVFLPFSTIHHHGQGSSNREFAIVNIYKGLQTFYSKNRSFVEQLYVKNLLSVKAVIIIFIAALVNKKELLTTYQKALKTIE